MIPFRDQPIRRKLILVSLLTSVLTLLVAVATAISYEYWRFRAQIVPDLSAQAEIIAENSAAALAFNDVQSATEVLASLHARKEIEFACLFTAEWKVFAKYSPRAPVNLAELRVMAHVGHQFKDSQLVLFRDVKQDDDIIGHLCLVADLSGQYASVRTYGFMAVCLTVALLLASVLFSGRLQRTVSQPILGLADIARGVTERKDYSLRATKLNRDEVGILTDAFNRMLAEIQERESKLERRSAQLQETNERLHTLIQTSPLAINVLDLDGRVVLWNAAAERMFGWTESELLGQHLPIIPDAQRPEFMKLLKEVLQAGPVNGREVRRLRKNGSPIDISLFTSPLRDVKGNITGTMGVIEDITGRKAAELALQERARLAALEADIGIALIHAGSMSDMLQRCCEALVKHLDAAFVRVWTLNESEDALERQASAGLYQPMDDADARVPVGQHEIGWVAQERQPLMTNQAIGDPRIHDQDWVRREGMMAFAGYPLLLGNRLVGVIAMFARQPLPHLTLAALGAVANEICLGVERRRAQTLLLESEERFRQVAENIREVFWMTDVAKNRMLYISPGYEEIWGRSRESLYESARGWLEAIHPEDRQRVLDAALTKQVRNEYSEEYRIVKPDGSIRWIHDRAYAVHDPNGAPYRVAGIAEDITERREALQAIRIQSEIARNMEEGVILVRASDSIIVYANPKFEQMFGYEPGGLNGKPVSVVDVPSATGPGNGTPEITTALRKTGKWSGEIHNRRKDGTPFWCFVNASAFEHPDHGTVWVSVQTDITDRKRAREELRDSQERLMAIMNNATTVIYLKDLEGRYLLVNRTYETLFHISNREIAGKLDSELFPTNQAEPLRANDLTVLQGKVPKQFEEVVPQDDGLHTYISIKFPLFDASGEPYAVCGISTDITERKQAEVELHRAHTALQKSHEELKSAQQRLVQAEKMESIGRLAANVAHDVKNPLGIALMGLEYLTGSLNSSDPDVERTCRETQEALIRADQVIHGLLDFSAPVKLMLHDEDLNAILTHALSLIRHELRKAKVNAVRDLAKGLPRLQLDENKLQQVVLNVCMNSIQAMPGGGELRVRTSVTKNQSGRNLVVAEIEDTGPGVPPELLWKVFDPFFSTKSVGKGHGLGLSIAKQIVELHGGTIELRNRPEGGAVVRMAFPA